MPVEYTIISIGALSYNRLWGEKFPVRTSHATTTLIEDAGRLILVDPSLPAAALGARFSERTGKGLSKVTDVFCTTLRPVHRRSIEALAQANWWACSQEIDAWRDKLDNLDQITSLLGEKELSADAELKLLDRIKPAPDQFSPQVQLFPLPGASPGGAGILLAGATSTVIIAGDAAITARHVLSGQVWEGSDDLKQAVQSLQDLLEIVDIIVPGHDNVMICPSRIL